MPIRVPDMMLARNQPVVVVLVVLLPLLAVMVDLVAVVLGWWLR